MQPFPHCFGGGVLVGTAVNGTLRGPESSSLTLSPHEATSARASAITNAPNKCQTFITPPLAAGVRPPMNDPNASGRSGVENVLSRIGASRPAFKRSAVGFQLINRRLRGSRRLTADR
jgi:hypothetical protein